MREERARFLKGLARAFAGAAIIGLPLALTTEMWWLGFYMERWKIALLIVSALPMMMFLSHFSGYSAQGHWKETILDGLVVFFVGLAISTLLLWLFGQLNSQTPFREAVGKIALQAIPAGMGAAIARSLLEATGEEEDEKMHRISKPRELFLRIVGALALGFDVAPTDEIPRIAAETRPWHMLALLMLCVAAMHGFAFGVEQKAHGSIPRNTGVARLLFTTTLPAYFTVLAVCAYLLWLFGRFAGVPLQQALAMTIVLGTLSSVGAGAVRVVL